MKPIQITLEQAKELLISTPSLTDVIYNTYPELKPKPIVPDSWESLGIIKGYCIDSNSHVGTEVFGLSSTCKDKNTFATEKQALSALAYAQLTQLMKATGDCDIDWKDYSIKYTITRVRNYIVIRVTDYDYHFLTFNTKSIRDEFFEKHRDLIKQYFQL